MKVWQGSKSVNDNSAEKDFLGVLAGSSAVPLCSPFTRRREVPVDPTAQPDKVQLHLVLPYKFQPTDEPRVKSLLDRGYRIVQLQRVTDREVIVTLTNQPA